MWHGDGRWAHSLAESIWAACTCGLASRKDLHLHDHMFACSSPGLLQTQTSCMKDAFCKHWQPKQDLLHAKGAVFCGTISKVLD